MKEQEGITYVPTDILLDNTISWQARFLLVILLGYKLKQFQRVNWAKVARQCGWISMPTLRRYRKELRARGFLDEDYCPNENLRLQFD